MKSGISLSNTTNTIFNIFAAAHGCLQKTQKFLEKVENEALWLVYKGQVGLGNRIEDVSNYLRNFGGRALHEAHLLEEGVVHIRSAPDEVKKHLRSDAADCAVEIALTVASEISLPETVAIAVAEVGEKAVHGAPQRRTLGSMAKDFVLSVLSSPLAALSAGKDVIHDLEDSGRVWEASHPLKKEPAAKQPVPVRVHN